MRTAVWLTVVGSVLLLGASGEQRGSPAAPVQNANHIPCYKEQADMTKVLFRWCPRDKAWTATNQSRTNCYSTSEACAEAEMPQSWCIKCGANE
jgi:hypothetical protein